MLDDATAKATATKSSILWFPMLIVARTKLTPSQGEVSLSTVSSRVSLSHGVQQSERFRSVSKRDLDCFDTLLQLTLPSSPRNHNPGRGPLL